MNITGHIAVAAGISTDPRVLLGSALPDLATFGGHRLLRPANNAAVAEGIRLHHRTDEAFHSSEWFQSRQRRLRTDLDARGVPRGPARAVAHVGPEMLLDGQLLTSSDTRDLVATAFAQLTVADHELELLVDSPDWTNDLATIQQRGLPTDYAEPHAVAKRLERILRRRPRLRLEADLVDVVAVSLSTEAQGIATTAEQLVADLVKDVVNR